MYDLVVSNTPNDTTALVARSRCYTQLGDLERWNDKHIISHCNWNCFRALLDAETVLKKDKKCQEALYQKAETLYQLGRYEHALVYYHRGHKVPNLYYSLCNNWIKIFSCVQSSTISASEFKNPKTPSLAIYKCATWKSWSAPDSKRIAYSWSKSSGLS